MFKSLSLPLHWAQHQQVINISSVYHELKGCCLWLVVLHQNPPVFYLKKSRRLVRVRQLIRVCVLSRPQVSSGDATLNVNVSCCIHDV